MMSRTLWLSLLLWTRLASAQDRVTVQGTAWDSLRGAPLAGALVALRGTGRSSTTDARGRFAFDTVTPGTYTFLLHHDVLDSIGLAGRSLTTRIDAAHFRFTLGVPSFATIWRALCGNAPPPRDSAIVHGTVRTTGGAAAAGAEVAVAWRVIDYSRARGVDDARFGGKVPVDAAGRYALCGVPGDIAVHVLAARDSLSSGRVDLPLLVSRVLRQDLVIGPVTAAAADLGVVAGTLRDESARPIAGGIVVVEGVSDTRSADDGRFVLGGVPAGTRQVEARAIGVEPATQVVEVRGGDTVHVSFTLRKVATLPEVSVKGRTAAQVFRRDIEERRRLGVGYFRDSTEIGRLAMTPSILDGIAGVRVIRGSSPSRFAIQNLQGCTMAVFIDRVHLTSFEFYMLHPDQIAVVEVYPRRPPDAFTAAGYCGSVVVWTKRRLR